MASTRDIIHDLPEYQGAQEERQEAAEQAAARNPGGPAGLGPVLNWEKTDVEFWTNVAQLVVLLLILRELRSGR